MGSKVLISSELHESKAEERDSNSLERKTTGVSV